MNDHELKERILKFDRWHYQFDLQGQLTPVDSPDKVNRHMQRKEHIFQPLIEYYGGSLKGKRVLDLGCNAGFWSLASIQNGCDYVCGIDGRGMHIEQAELVFEVNDISKDRFDFTRGNIFDVDLQAFEPFDVVLLLGIMYHINRPIEIIEKIQAINSDLLVIDTVISKSDGATIDIIKESLQDPRNALENELVFVPSRQAVVEMTEHYGYNTTVMEPEFSDDAGVKDYQQGTRRVFFCSKSTSG